MGCGRVGHTVGERVRLRRVDRVGEEDEEDGDQEEGVGDYWDVEHE